MGKVIEYDDKSKHDNVKASVQTWLEKECAYNVHVTIDGSSHSQQEKIISY